MLIIKVGNDGNKRNKIPRIDADTVVNLGIGELGGIRQYLSPDIFGTKYRVNLMDWNNEEGRKIVYSNLDEMREAENIFVIDEGEILDATLKKLSGIASNKVKVYDCREVVVKDNPFHLAELIVKKKRKEAWLEYMRLLKTGESIEALIGVMNWKMNQVRDVSGSYFLLKSLADDHDSKGDAEIEIEKYILKL